MFHQIGYPEEYATSNIEHRTSNSTYLNTSHRSECQFMVW